MKGNYSTFNLFLNSFKNLRIHKFSRLFRVDERDKISPGLSAVADSLEDVYKSLDPRFMQIGRELQSIHFEAARLTEQILKSVKLIGRESGEGILVHIGNLTRESLTELRNCRADVPNSVGRVNAVAGYLGELYAKCSLI